MRASVTSTMVMMGKIEAGFDGTYQNYTEQKIGFSKKISF
jgi:hypothetical protein